MGQDTYIRVCVCVAFLFLQTLLIEKSFTLQIFGCDTKQTMLGSSPGSSRGQVSELVCFNRTKLTTAGLGGPQREAFVVHRSCSV